MKYKLIRKHHQYAIENNLRSWSVYFEVWENEKLICECFEVRPIMWYAISSNTIVTGKSRKDVISQINNRS